MFYYIYKITNVVNNIFYIGSHKTQDLNDGYFGSGIYLKRAIKKHGKENFRKEIVLYCNSEVEMREKETEYLLGVRNENVYNLKFCALGGNTRATYTKKEKKQYIQKLIDNPDSPIGKKGTDAFNYGTSLSKQTKKKQSNSHKKRWENIKTSPEYSDYRKALKENALGNIDKMAAKRRKKIHLKDKQTGKTFKFCSLTQCIKETGLSTYMVHRLKKGYTGHPKYILL